MRRTPAVAVAIGLLLAALLLVWALWWAVRSKDNKDDTPADKPVLHYTQFLADRYAEWKSGKYRPTSTSAGAPVTVIVLMKKERDNRRTFSVPAGVTNRSYLLVWANEDRMFLGASTYFNEPVSYTVAHDGVLARYDDFMAEYRRK